MVAVADLDWFSDSESRAGYPPLHGVLEAASVLSWKSHREGRIWGPRARSLSFSQVWSGDRQTGEITPLPSYKAEL